MSVPKVIHYIWIGKEMPELYKRCINSWHVYHPGWEVLKWDESAFENNDVPPYFSKAIKDKKYAFAADYLRCYILYNQGGIYIDADMECIKCFSPLLSRSFIGLEGPERLSNGVMGFEPKHKLIKKLLDFYDKNVGVYKTMPRLTTEIFNEVKFDDVEVYNENTFYPYNPFRDGSLEQLMYQDISSDTFAIHHWGKSWKMSRWETLLSYLRNLL